MIPRVSLFLAGCMRRFLTAAVPLAAFAPLALSAQENGILWGRLITSAAIVCDPSAHKIPSAVNGAVDSARRGRRCNCWKAATHLWHLYTIALAITFAANRIGVAINGVLVCQRNRR